MKSKQSKSHPLWQAFWLAFLVASLAYAWYSYYVPSTDMVWEDNMVMAEELADKSDKNILIFFTGEWCVPCRIMKRTVFADEEVMKAINKQVVPVMIDIDEPNAVELIKKYNIRSTPITLFTDSKGNVLDYAVGRIEKDYFLEMLKNIDSD